MPSIFLRPIHARTLYLPNTASSVWPNHHLGHPTTKWEGCRHTSQGYITVRARDSVKKTSLYDRCVSGGTVTFIQIGARKPPHEREDLRRLLVLECRLRWVRARFCRSGCVVEAAKKRRC